MGGTNILIYLLKKIFKINFCIYEILRQEFGSIFWFFLWILIKILPFIAFNDKIVKSWSNIDSRTSYIMFTVLIYVAVYGVLYSIVPREYCNLNIIQSTANHLVLFYTVLYSYSGDPDMIRANQSLTCAWVAPVSSYQHS